MMKSPSSQIVDKRDTNATSCYFPRMYAKRAALTKAKRSQERKALGRSKTNNLGRASKPGSQAAKRFKVRLSAKEVTTECAASAAAAAVFSGASQTDGGSGPQQQPKWPEGLVISPLLTPPDTSTPNSEASTRPTLPRIACCSLISCDFGLSKARVVSVFFGHSEG